MDQKTIYKFLNSQATENEELALKSWVEESAENEHLFLEQRKLYDSLTLLKDEDDLRQVLLSKTDSSSGRRIPLFREILKIASVAVIAFLIGYLAVNKPEENKYTAMQTITVPAGQRINILLPDGTNVWLNAQTTIEYPVSFNNKERFIKLDGQAYFEVKHDSEVPFIVETVKGRIRVLGTKFDVLSYSNSDTFETALMEGSVEVALSSDPTQVITLSPDTKAYMESDKLYKVPLVDQNPYRWKEGLISFEDCPFENIMKEFEKSYGVKIIIQNSRILKYSYTGKFRVIDGIDHALRVLQKDLRFTYNRDPESNDLYIK
ncbi:FecR family protein [Dysgonomonas sp. 511]|uniref:FecR family protein n=1 Tax=Dysgonomonas sp. 511 TaxID=2302930 RepID=UPI0013D79857|nr:FecR domain-containing protein [Dysgonomonas sp. 511]NDV79313.1 DUF4974 domain-containing protein [Dysgonomonas sp. 511]